MRDITDFDSISIHIASPEDIRSMSYGEVKKAETINYRTLKPEKEGLFCERIFGTQKEMECSCGKYKSQRFKGVVCERCGVEVSSYKVRRERSGHIELASPVAHIWYYKTTPSRIATILGIQSSQLKSILYFEKYIVIDAGDTDLKEKQILTEDEYIQKKEQFGLGFTAMTGAEAFVTLLQEYDEQGLQAEVDKLREEMFDSSHKNDKKLLQRIELLEDFIQSKNKPEWMMLSVIPVIPPDLRPMVQLDGGRFASSDLNDLYRRVINRNNRLKRLLEIGAPEVIVNNEKRMLQDAVDCLFDNTKKKKAVKGTSQRALKSLSDMLKGKQGRFRQNLLGKRVDYSGRSVIVVGPNLKMHQCGLPVKMALELFKPFVMHKLVAKDIVFNVKKAKQMVEEENPEVFHILEEVVSEHPVLLNRAPTLHRLGIQAFEPVLVDGKAIRLHPLVCKAFNADFDGDQMAVHVPLSLEAQAESWMLMLSAKNLLDPANGKPIVGPSQDMVLGIYYMTHIKKGVKGEGKYFKDVNEVMIAANVGAIHLQATINVYMDNQWVQTSAGRIFFNDNMPDGIEFINEPLGAKQLKDLIAKVYKRKGSALTVRMLDAIKDTGYKYAMIFGATIGLEDIIVPSDKKEIIDNAQKEVDKLYKQYKEGSITKEERFQKVTDEWKKAQDTLLKSLNKTYREDRDGFNPVYMMADSGARGSETQMRQLSGMRGLMTKPGGELIELPIKSNFREGLNVIEFYISTNGARKGLADTALRTADAGYMTRRLVDVAQDVITNEEDCGTINGVDMSAIKEGEKVVETLRDRILGRFSVEEIRHPITGDLIVEANGLLSEDVVDKIEEAYIETVKVRTVLTCEAKRGVCVKCYGRNLATNTTTDLGEAVGVIAAQSIGQPGTQLTMRTFHEGGIAKGAAQENTINYNYRVLFDDFKGFVVETNQGNRLVSRKSYIYISKINREFDITNCTVKVSKDEKIFKGKELFVDANDQSVKAEELGYAKILGNKLYVTNATQEVEIKPGSQLFKQVGDVIEANDPILEFDTTTDPIISENAGVIKFVDLKFGNTVIEEKSETGVVNLRIADSGSESLQPRLAILNSSGVEIDTYLLPGGTILNVKENQKIEKGEILAKIVRKSSTKSADITGGLPRVNELFDARKPKDPAVIAKVSGTVHFKGKVKSKELIEIVDDFGNVFKHTIPSGAYILVRNGDMIRAGEKLSEGSINPHDVLAILGENVCQKFLMDEIQSVYRLQGVEINDKHIGVIIRQMMRKVEIQDAGNTHFIIGQKVDKTLFYEENRKTIKEGGQPAVARSILLGITKAALAVDSFLSSASFQETTKVLTNASIKGMTDRLYGLKENVIIGHLIPAGTGLKKYKNIKLYDENMEDLDVKISKMMEARQLVAREVGFKSTENS